MSLAEKPRSADLFGRSAAIPFQEGANRAPQTGSALGLLRSQPLECGPPKPCTGPKPPPIWWILCTGVCHLALIFQSFTPD